jgi:2'-5' RNA ligase
MAKMYFIAIVAPKEIADDVLNWKNLMKERFNCLVALRSPTHITLVPPFWMDELLEHKLKDSIAAFSQQQPSFEIYLENFGAFRPRVIFVDVVANRSLEALYAQLLQFLIAPNIFPVKKDDRPFHPHITIATRDLHKKTFQEAWEIFSGKEYKTSWRAESVSLLRHNQKNWDVIFTSQFQN